MSLTTTEWILGSVFGIIIFLNIDIPYPIAVHLDTPAGHIVFICAAICMFLIVSPLVAILAGYALFRILYAASSATGTISAHNAKLYETKKWSIVSADTYPEYTLEEEMVKKMASTKFKTTPMDSAVKPVYSDIHNAAYIDAE